LVVFRVPEAVAALVEERRYLPRGAYLMKPVVGVEGDWVCTEGAELRVGGVSYGAIPERDRDGRRLPRWEFCGVVPPGALVVATPAGASFDSRRFGALPRATFSRVIPTLLL
jgi:type IV secretory pathway protease TraF